MHSSHTNQKGAPEGCPSVEMCPGDAGCLLLLLALSIIPSQQESWASHTPLNDHPGHHAAVTCSIKQYSTGLKTAPAQVFVLPRPETCLNGVRGI